MVVVCLGGVLRVEDFSIEIQSRSEGGKVACKRMRKQGWLPVVVYHRGEESVAAKVDTNKFIQLAQKAAASQVFTFKSDDSKLAGRLGLVKEIQRDYLKGQVLHVDFQTLKEDEKVRVHVPIVLVGDAPGVKIEGGVLTVEMREMLVEALPRQIPHEIKVDISKLHINHSIHVSDLDLPGGVETFNEPGEAVVSVVESRTSKSMELETETPSAEGEEKAAASPEKPAADTEEKEKK